MADTTIPAAQAAPPTRTHPGGLRIVLLFSGLALLLALTFGTGLIVGNRLDIDLLALTPLTVIPEYASTNYAYYPFHIFDAEPPLPGVPTLQELAGGAVTDQAIVDRVVAFYEANALALQTTFRETHPARLKALLAM